MGDSRATWCFTFLAQCIRQDPTYQIGDRFFHRISGYFSHILPLWPFVIITTTDQGGLWEWYSTPALRWKGSRKRNIRRSWQRSSIRKEGFDWSWSRNVQINICEFVEIEAGSDSLHLNLDFASSCCLFVRLIISDFLLRLLVFVGSPSHISSAAAFSHPGQSGKATTSAADALRDRRSFGFSFSDWGTGCA